jgi:hypothetical protein
VHYRQWNIVPPFHLQLSAQPMHWESMLWILINFNLQVVKISDSFSKLFPHKLIVAFISSRAILIILSALPRILVIRVRDDGVVFAAILVARGWQLCKLMNTTGFTQLVLLV